MGRADHRIPPYFDALIEAFRRGGATRFVHLGYWEGPAGEADSGSDAEFAQAQQHLDELLLGMARLADGQAILDVGCGFGGTLASIGDRHSRMQLAGLNIDERQLALCREIAPGANRLEWTQGDACALPFASGVFDRVLCFEAMFHFRSRRTFFLEAARVLKPGGSLVGSDITFCAAARRLERPQLRIADTLREGYGPWPDLWGEDADHAELARSAGLRCAAALDATAQTLPTHRFTSPGGDPMARLADDAWDNPPLRAALMLRWLHTEGHLRYGCFRFDKPGGGF